MNKPVKLNFATAGIPISAKNSTTVEGIKKVRELNLDGMELEFVRNINITKEKAPEIRKTAQENKILLTCHAPYYINLNAQESSKKYASIYRIKKSAEILYSCGGWSVCFHAGYYLNMEKEKVYENIKKNIVEIKKQLDEKNIDIWLRPETTGKKSQFGSLKELLKLSQEIEKVMPVIDFSHLHARTNGKYNTKEEFSNILELVENTLGKEGLNNMHIHVSGIEYNEKGERYHLNLQESDLNYSELVETWKDFRIRGIVVSESPNIEQDAMLLQKIYNEL